MRDLTGKYGKWVLITGASSGIGESFAKYLAENGFNLVLVARREEKMNEIAKDMKERYGTESRVIPLDLTEESSYRALFDKTSDLEVGLLINNAGFGAQGRYKEISEEKEYKMVKLNCLAVYALAKHYAKNMIARKKGGIIITGSAIGCFTAPYFSTYSATKAFDMYLGEGLWYELREHGVDVLSLAPGGTDTEFQERANAGSMSFYRTPEQVVITAMKSIGKKPRVVDGFVNKLFVTILNKLLPKKTSVKLAGKTIKKEVEKKEKNSGENE